MFLEEKVELGADSQATPCPRIPWVHGQGSPSRSHLVSMRYINSQPQTKYLEFLTYTEISDEISIILTRIYV